MFKEKEKIMECLEFWIILKGVLNKDEDFSELRSFLDVLRLKI
jgi:hypothetical protein